MRPARALVLASSVALLCGCSLLPGFRREPRPLPAPAPAPPPVDHRPPEVRAHPRARDPQPQITFDRLLGWTVEAAQPGRLQIERSETLPLWGSSSGHLTGRRLSAHETIVLRPPEPVKLPELFDSFAVWLSVGNAGPNPPACEIGIRFADARGVEHEESLGPIAWPGWSLLHHRIPPGRSAELAHPCQLRGLLVRPLQDEVELSVAFDSAAIYTETLPALDWEPQPQRGAPPFPGQDHGLNTGIGHLPFPVPGGTVAPPNHSGWRNALSREASGLFVLEARSEAGEVRFVVHPDRGIEDIACFWNQESLGRVFVGGGIESEVQRGRPLVVRIEGDRLHIRYANGENYALHLRGASLCVEASMRGGRARSFALGRIELPSSRPLPFPDLPGGGGEDSVVLMAQPPFLRQPLFASAYVDWTVSGGSSLQFRNEANGSLGGVRYERLTSGLRNDLFERAVISVSGLLQEVLPSIPHPKAERADDARFRAVFSGSGRIGLDAHVSRAQRLAALGVDDVVFCENRLAAGSAPRAEAGWAHAMGDAVNQAREGIGSLHELGWWIGLSQDYHNINPLRPRWQERTVRRLGSGEWMKAQGPAYAMKPSYAEEAQTRMASELRTRFGASAAFHADHLLHPPWEATDFDARLPGAGSFAQTYYLYGDMLLRESGISGPVYAPDAHAWLYAGLADGLIDGLHAAPVRGDAVLPPVFGWWRINALSVHAAMVAGTSEPGGGDGEGFNRQLADLLIANKGLALDGESLDDVDVARAYFSILPLQRQYLLRMPERVGLWDGQRLLSIESALASGAHARRQFYFLYDNGLELWVNGHASEAWGVTVDRDQWVLPPFGWVARSDGLFAVSALEGARRFDYVECAEWIYLDGGGAEARFRGVAAKGPVVLRRCAAKEGALAELIDVQGQGAFAVGAGGWIPTPPAAAEAYDASGLSLGRVQAVPDGDLRRFPGVEGARRYRLF